MGITAIISIISTIVSDAPTLFSLVEKIVPLIKEDRAPTTDEWNDLINEVKTAHDSLVSTPLATTSEVSK